MSQMQVPVSELSQAQASREQVERLRHTFRSSVTRDERWRRAQLAGIAVMMQECEARIVEALREDLRKSKAECLTGEVDYVTKEAKKALKSLGRWMKPKNVSTPLAAAPSRSQIIPQPYGVALIIGAWNYPFQEIYAPLVGAVAAGNCALLKPSELAPASSALIADMTPNYLDPAAVSVIEGDAAVTANVLEQKFDKIFYTGGSRVGRIVMAAAARHLTPVTLELGGKNPAIICADADLEVSARRIAWGRYMNAGQICVAPDYALVEETVIDDFGAELDKAITAFYGENPQESTDYGRIINDRHFDRLTGLLEGERVVIGGVSDKTDRYIAPTVLANVSAESAIMQEEVFGPILPILPFSHRTETISFINDREAALALYVFSRDAGFADDVIEQTQSGTVMVNDAVLFQANAALPFGGIGESGMGAFHGKHSFDTFSHHRAVMKRGFALDSALRYPPYDDKKLSLLRRLT